MGFAEIEIYSEGGNVALGKAVTSEGLRYGNRKLEAVTDGNNLYGKILPVREWMAELALRGALERERPFVARELNYRFDKQKALLTRMIQLVVLLSVGIAFLLLIDRIIRQRKISQVRERIAADLHDDLGANIHTIGLISDMAKNSVDSRGELLELLDQIRDFTERSGEAARYCTNILEARGICEDLVHEIEQFSSRLLADMEHETTFKGEQYLHALSAHKRIDLLLFFKECLTNVLRHSGATKVTSLIYADQKSVAIIVTDNGRGLIKTNNGKIPYSLRRRARLLGARLKTEAPAQGGTRLILRLNTRKFGIFK
jgi:signal transduction histidine kinase